MIRLRGATTDVVLDDATGVPAIVHWGPPLGERVDLPSITAALDRPLVHGGLDAVAPSTLVPEHGAGWPGRPGLLGHRARGRHWAPRFVPAGVARDGDAWIVDAVDEHAALRLRTRVELDHALVIRLELVNEGTGRYHLDGLTVTLPLPERADDLGILGGRWAREFRQHRIVWPTGAFTWENRSGRTSHAHAPVVFAGERGWGEWRGPVWGAHLAWSGNHVVHAERLLDGRRVVQLGELLHPGEVVLEPGESYRTPEVVAVHGDGATPASWAFHRHLRARPGHPASPRPVMLNTWEAVYFDHDEARLRELATVAASVGVERFVLDDGWFGARRDDTAGLGTGRCRPRCTPTGSNR